MIHIIEHSKLPSIKQKIEQALEHGGWEAAESQAASIIAQTYASPSKDLERDEVISSSYNSNQKQKYGSNDTEQSNNNDNTSMLWTEISKKTSISNTNDDDDENEGASIAANWAISRSLSHLLEDTIARKDSHSFNEGDGDVTKNETPVVCNKEL